MRSARLARSRAGSPPGGRAGCCRPGSASGRGTRPGGARAVRSSANLCWPRVARQRRGQRLILGKITSSRCACWSAGQAHVTPSPRRCYSLTSVDRRHALQLAGNLGPGEVRASRPPTTFSARADVPAARRWRRGWRRRGPSPRRVAQGLAALRQRHQVQADPVAPPPVRRRGW